VLRQAPIRALWEVLSEADYALVALALANVVLILIAKTSRWRLLFYPLQQDADYQALLSALTAGVFVNFALPVLRFGDLVRAYLAGLTGASRLHALGTVAVEKLLDMIALAITLLLLLPFIDLPPWLLRPAWALSSAALIVLLAGIVFKDRVPPVLHALESRLPILSRLGASEKTKRVLDSLEPLSHGAVLLKMAGWTILVWTLSFLTHVLVLQALGLRLSLLAPLLLHTVLQAGVAVPSSPGNLGVFHALCVWTLSLFDVTGPTAVTYSILLYAVVWTPPTILGVISLWRSGKALELLRLTHKEAQAPASTGH